MANTVLRKDYSGAGNKQKQTISVWVKRCAGLGGNQAIFSVRHTGNSNYYGYLRFKTNNSLEYYTNTPSIQMRTNRLFRDTNAWYHIVITLDTTQSTEADRIKIYINGVQETSFQTATYPSQNAEVTFGDDYRHEIGSYDASYYFDGVMSHFYFITNTAYQASTFGSTDSTTGEWQINTSPTITYATNSFFILKDGNSGTDQSGQGNNYSVAGGTLTKTEDNPSNVFATLNPLVYESRDNTFSNGNNTITGGGSDSWTNKYGTSTIAPSSGKYYVEAKLITKVSSQAIIGLISTSQALSGSLKDNGVFALETEGRITGSGNNIQTGLTAFSNGDIVGLAFDATNGTAQFYRNGSTYGNALSSIPSDTYYFATSTYSTGGVINFNFGNGYFGTTAVSSAGTNASGIGIFEYDVPTGYTALSTKGLNL